MSASRCRCGWRTSKLLSPTRARREKCLTIPIGHMEGNYFCDAATLQELRRDNRVVFRYSSPGGEITGVGQSQRIAGKHRRDLQSWGKCCGHDASPRALGRAGTGLHRWPENIPVDGGRDGGALSQPRFNPAVKLAEFSWLSTGSRYILSASSPVVRVPKPGCVFTSTRREACL